MINIPKVEIPLYNKKLNLYVQDQISLNDNCVYVLFGQNGIGKSTFGKLLSGFEKLTSDFIGNRKFLFHPQESLFVPGTSQENMEFYLDRKLKLVYPFIDLWNNNGCPPETVNFIKEFLINIGSKEINELSGGQKQLLLFLRSILIFLSRSNKFSGIIFDEPAKELSSDRVKILTTIFGNIKIKDPLLFISHDFNFIYSLISVFINKKEISFIEFSEREMKGESSNNISKPYINIEMVGSLKAGDTLYSDWIDLTCKSEYIKNLFGINNNIVNENKEKIKLILNEKSIVVGSFPTFHGLFETILKSGTDSNKFYKILTIKLPKENEIIAPELILCNLD